MQDLIELFTKIGISPSKAKETAKNAKVSSKLKEIICESSLSESASPSSSLLLSFSTMLSSLKEKEDDDDEDEDGKNGKQLSIESRKFITAQICSSTLTSDLQLKEAIAYCTSLNGAEIDTKDFNEACGVGVIVDEETIKKAITKVLDGHSAKLKEEAYLFPLSTLMMDLKNDPSIKWAPRPSIKTMLDDLLEERIGKRPSADELKKLKGEKQKKANQKKEEHRQFSGQITALHKPGENPQIKPELMEEHLKFTGGRVITRFPPEPNGYLHIGHCKAMNINFRYAEANGGLCNLRFDDTNPESEELRYYDAIKEAVEWMGFRPSSIHAASDYFPRLYEIACSLIQKGKAYVCHMSQEEISMSRGGPDGKLPKTESPWRNRAVAESLREFQRMKDGLWEEGKATLRLKQDMMNSGNPFMWDMVAYRVLKAKHCRTGNQWNIYPMYDFTHCLSDSIENITHSMCTTEFIAAREAYYWVCDAAQVYKPVQWEYSRLNITQTVTSKRKLQKLVESGLINGWDDPRVYTIAGMRRRGFTPEAINTFVEGLGVTTSYSVVDVKRLENVVRDDLNHRCVRRMAIIDPLEVVIVNGCGGDGDGDSNQSETTISLPDNPANPECKTSSSLTFDCKSFWIEREDFDHTGKIASYFRLTPDQPVGIYKVGVVRCVDFCLSSNGSKVEKVMVELLGSGSNGGDECIKPKTFISWLPKDNCLKGELRMYSSLFKSQNPESNPDGYMADIDSSSVTVVKDCLLDPRLKGCKVEDKFQFQRMGYFCVDPDTLKSENLEDQTIVLNLTVSLKEDSGK